MGRCKVRIEVVYKIQGEDKYEVQGGGVYKIQGRERCLGKRTVITCN